jgi:group I intron endonuclease
MHIYTIKNLVNGKMYVGQTIQANAKMRWYAHCDMVRKGKKSHLYDSMRKHGIKKFLWEIVEQADTIEELNELETVWANKLRAQGITLYNNRETGNNKKHSAESIEKMRRVHKLRHATNVIGGWKRRDGGPMKDKMHNEETKILMSQSAYTREARKRGEL